MSFSQEQIVAALRNVRDPKTSRDIVSLEFIKRVVVDDTHVRVSVELPDPTGPERGIIEREIRLALSSIGVRDLNLEIAGRKPAAGTAAQSALPQVKHVIAVGAGKGGVGKSTLALNMAVGLAREGMKVGLMDGDIYGPSMPTMLGVKGLPPQIRGAKMLPFYVHGIHAVTIGSLVEQDKPLIWRGPMAHGAFKQLLIDNTEWPDLDYLLVDLPPGTGDVPLTLCQLLPLTGAVVVATPQQVALDDAVRAVRMFQHLGTSVLGLVENMSYIPLSNGQTMDIFGRGGTEKAAQQLSLPYLGALPLYPELRVNCDAGNPSLNFTGNVDLAKALQAIVQNLLGQVRLRDLASPAPELTIS